MTRAEPTETLRRVAREAEASGQPYAAGVLFTLCGALESGDERELFELCGPFVVRQLERLTGQPDWSDDTLKV